MRPVGFVVLSVAALFGAGCLDMVVPLHQSNVNAPDGSAMNQNPTGDMASMSASDGGTTTPPPSDGGAPLDMSDCILKSATAIDGHHHMGEDCLSCHKTGGPTGATPFLVAGTLYDSAAGTTGLALATIRITDGAGKHADLVTSSQTENGNFYLEAANANGLTPPFNVEASSCPNTQRMGSQVTAANLSCNNCHNGTIQARIHLP